MHVPHCYRADLDATTHAHVLLLEDLPEFAPGDLRRGLTVDEAQRFVRQIAGLHASRWGLEAPPSSAETERYRDFYRSQVESSMGFLGQFLEVDDHALVDRFGRQVLEWLRRLAAAPQTLNHGDAHGANVLFEPVEGGDLAIIDWQGWRTGAGILDVARFLTLSLPSDVRREAEAGLVASYVAALAEGGVEYPSEQAWADYRAGSGWQWGWAVNFSRHASTWSDDTRDLMHTLVPRAVEALRDAARSGLLD
ncbi:MAG: phosphotransferase [Dehalococcoidia bacterium]|nr:phosphotransferase [Dehalococcoidia bacterium]